MNSDSNDPKNHVPPVSRGDDWGDLDRVADTPQIGLPPKRPDRGIPAKRDLNPVSAKRHSPTPKLYDDAQILSSEPIYVAPKTRAKAATKVAKKVARKAATKGKKGESKRATKQSAKKQSSDKSLQKKVPVPRKASKAKVSEGKYVSVIESTADEKDFPLPVTVAHGFKRFRVNEIAAQQPVEKRMQKSPLTITRMAGKRASNEAIMKSGVTHSSEAISSTATNVRLTLAWVIGAGTVIVFIVVGAILISRPSKGDSEPGKLSGFSSITEEESDKGSDSKGSESLDTLINGEKQAKAIFATYATSKSVDDFIGMIYRPEKNRGVISKNWEPMDVVLGWEPEENCNWEVMERGGVKYGVLAGVLADFSIFRAIFRQDGDSIKMDWRATTGHCSADYAELKKGEGEGSEIRAILSPGDFYTFTLPEGEFRCYRVTAPDREENIWAYTKLNGANDEMLLSQFIPSQLTGDSMAEIPVQLELVRGPAQSLPNQWIISKVTRLSWLDE